MLCGRGEAIAFEAAVDRGRHVVPHATSGRVLDLEANHKGCSREADPAQTITPPYAHCRIPSPASPSHGADAVGLCEGQIGSKEKSFGHKLARLVLRQPPAFAWPRRHLVNFRLSSAGHAEPPCGSRMQ